MTDKQIDDILHAVIPTMGKALHRVLISHAPPYGTLDLINGNHVGSSSLRKHMDNFDLVCCAHIHEAKGVTEVDGVKIVNPGPAAVGDCAMLQFGGNPKDIRIELLTV